MLHRSSECTRTSYNNTAVLDHLLDKKIPIQKIWQLPISKKSINDNVILQAGTGSGKTEFALFWLNGKKGFYTLPIRTSVNAMYDRLCEIYEKQNKDSVVGLMHSDSAFYLMDKQNDGMFDSFKVLDESKQLSMPISVSTADQLFTAVFRYPGYEKIYATLACSKLVIDEIQSYNPEIVAVILKGLEDLHNLGCKFCIITATLPSFYLQHLEEKNILFQKILPKFKKQPRHKIVQLDHSIVDKQVLELIKQQLSNSEKMLVITNTVSAAIKVKNILYDNGIFCDLLHSRFILKHRKEKESKIKSQNNKGVWITTQLVETSLDIDFDVLITEISTADSQIQRWGRVWRNQEKRKAYKGDLPNIFITTNPSDDGKIYDSKITELTKKQLQQNQNKLLSDYDEYIIVQNVFSTKNIKDTEYMKKFESSLKILYDINLTLDNKSQAQKLFRDINDISVIPKTICDIYKDDIDSALINLNYFGKDNRMRRYQAFKIIKENSVSIPYSYFEKNKSRSIIINDKYNIVIFDVPYSYDLGIELN